MAKFSFSLIFPQNIHISFYSLKQFWLQHQKHFRVITNKGKHNCLCSLNCDASPLSKKKSTNSHSYVNAKRFAMIPPPSLSVIASFLKEMKVYSRIHRTISSGNKPSLMKGYSIYMHNICSRESCSSCTALCFGLHYTTLSVSDLSCMNRGAKAQNEVKLMEFTHISHCIHTLLDFYKQKHAHTV